MKQVIVIAGPTASGKSKLAVELAKTINGEIISADSMQIYKDMDIGTAKVTKEEMEGIPHYMIDIVSPEERYSVSDFKKQAEMYIEKILAKGKIPIIVGGTGLYIDSLIYGIEFQEQEIDEEYRNEMNDIAEREGLNKLYELAMKIDSEATKKISSNDKKRIIRILEIYHSTGKTKTQMEKESRKKGVKYNYKVFALNMERDLLYNRINQRVDKMIAQGLVEEVKTILNKYSNFPTAMQGLGYKEIIKYLNGENTIEEAVEIIKQESRHYAKRQLTWFRKNKEVIWLQANNDSKENINNIMLICKGEEPKVE